MKNRSSYPTSILSAVLLSTGSLFMPILGHAATCKSVDKNGVTSYSQCQDASGNQTVVKTSPSGSSQQNNDSANQNRNHGSVIEAGTPHKLSKSAILKSQEPRPQ